jgi:hypothetical protein
MKTSLFILGILFSLVLSSFSKARTESAELIGCWSFSEFNEGFYWEKTPKIKERTAGYEFKSDGTLIKRHPKNWQEDPPVTFADYPGTWKMPNPDMIELIYNFPDGTSVRETVQIKSLKDGKLHWERLDWVEVRE